MSKYLPSITALNNALSRPTSYEPRAIKRIQSDILSHRIETEFASPLSVSLRETCQKRYLGEEALSRVTDLGIQSLQIRKSMIDRKRFRAINLSNLSTFKHLVDDMVNNSPDVTLGNFNPIQNNELAKKVEKTVKYYLPTGASELRKGRGTGDEIHEREMKLQAIEMLQQKLNLKKNKLMRKRKRIKIPFNQKEDSLSIENDEFYLQSEGEKNFKPLSPFIRTSKTPSALFRSKYKSKVLTKSYEVKSSKSDGLKPVFSSVILSDQKERIASIVSKIKFNINSEKSSIRVLNKALPQGSTIRKAKLSKDEITLYRVGFVSL